MTNQKNNTLYEPGVTFLRRFSRFISLAYMNTSPTTTTRPNKRDPFAFCSGKVTRATHNCIPQKTLGARQQHEHVHHHRVVAQEGRRQESCGHSRVAEAFTRLQREVDLPIDYRCVVINTLIMSS